MADFGLKKFYNSKFKIRINKDLGYISPEYLDKDYFDRKRDIWALGCIFYELVLN